MAKKTNVSAQDDKFNPPMNGEENAQNDKDAAAGEDVQNENDNEDQEQPEDSSPDGEDQEQPEDGSPDGENQEQPEHVSQILTATYPILYLSHQYKIGDELPTNDPEMIKAWLAAKTAVWMPTDVGRKGNGK